MPPYKPPLTPANSSRSTIPTKRSTIPTKVTRLPPASDPERLNLHHPAEGVLRDSILDIGEGLEELLSDRAAFAGAHPRFAAVFQSERLDARDDRRRPAGERFAHLPRLDLFEQPIEWNRLFAHRNAERRRELQDAVPGDAGQQRARQRRRNQHTA